jgi:hypothetical protein
MSESPSDSLNKYLGLVESETKFQLTPATEKYLREIFNKWASNAGLLASYPEPNGTDWGFSETNPSLKPSLTEEQKKTFARLNASFQLKKNDNTNESFRLLATGEFEQYIDIKLGDFIYSFTIYSDGRMDVRKYDAEYMFLQKSVNLAFVEGANIDSYFTE